MPVQENYLLALPFVDLPDDFLGRGTTPFMLSLQCQYQQSGFISCP